ncbi:Protein of unknown function (DUF1091) [Popillia japonica]|uniref:Uncharacterized protein n=1 Tax=Popillia japonica TaxID=7064 RepID=A0AAW1MYL0_POPJA
MFHQENYDIDLEYVKMNYVNPIYFKYFILRNVKPNRTYRATSGQIAALRDLKNSLKINIRGYKIVDNIPKIPIMQFDVPLCEAFERNILGIDKLRMLSSNITKCPLKMGVYIFHNFKVIAQDLPPYIPQGHYMFNISLFEEKVLLVHGITYASVIYKNV